MSDFIPRMWPSHSSRYGVCRQCHGPLPVNSDDGFCSDSCANKKATIDRDRRDDTVAGKTARQHAGIALGMLAGISGFPGDVVVEVCPACLGDGEITVPSVWEHRGCDIETVSCPKCSGTGTTGRRRE